MLHKHLHLIRSVKFSHWKEDWQLESKICLKAERRIPQYRNMNHSIYHSLVFSSEFLQEVSGSLCLVFVCVCVCVPVHLQK